MNVKSTAFNGAPPLFVSNYDRFLAYQKNASAFERATLLNFARTAVSHDSHSLQSTMYSLQDVVLGTQLNQKHPDTSSTSAGHRRRRYAVKHGLFRELKSLIEVGSKPKRRGYFERKRWYCGFDYLALIWH